MPSWTGKSLLCADLQADLNHTQQTTRLNYKRKFKWIYNLCVPLWYLKAQLCVMNGWMTGKDVGQCVTECDNEATNCHKWEKSKAGMWIVEDLRSERVPEGFADHVLVGDAVVGQCLTPYRVQGVTQSLGPELVGLNEKTKFGMKSNHCVTIYLETWKSVGWQNWGFVNLNTCSRS